MVQIKKKTIFTHSITQKYKEIKLYLQNSVNDARLERPSELCIPKSEKPGKIKTGYLKYLKYCF